MSISGVTLQNVLGLSLYVIATLGQHTEEFAVRSSTSLCLDFGGGRDVSEYAVGNLPNVNFDLPASWAGQISVPDTANDELFFWLFEAEVAGQCDNLIIWLNGGPGCSSLDGLTKENGPLYFPGNASTPTANPNSWTQLANVLYIDQPVGTGYSDGSNQASLNAQVTQDFASWLQAFYDIFPSLRQKNTYIMGESYAGVYIPYFTQAFLANNSLSFNLKGIAIGDGSFGNLAASTDVVATTYLNEHHQTLQIPQDVLNLFDQADQVCGFTQILKEASYPPSGPLTVSGDPEGANYRLMKRQNATNDNGCPQDPDTPALLNSSLSLCNGGCATWTTAANYLTSNRPCFSVYNIEYNCDNAPDTIDFVNWLNLPAVREAIHAPNKTYQDCNNTVFDTLAVEQVEPPAYRIIPAILEAGIPIHLYSGDNDFLLSHIGTEVVIQNMTWCGHQGFQTPPNNTFLVNGKNMGNWGYERGLSYHHILFAGHAVPYDQPAAAFAFVRDFVVGDAGYR